MPPFNVTHRSDDNHQQPKHGPFHEHNPAYIPHKTPHCILRKERRKRYDRLPGRRRAVYVEADTTQTTSIKRIPAFNKYQIFPRASSSISFNKSRNTSVRFASVPGQTGIKEEVNLTILPFGALFLFIIVCLLYISRWCIEDIREADRAIVTTTTFPKRNSDRLVPDFENQSSYHVRNESCDDSDAAAFRQSAGNYGHLLNVNQLNKSRRNRNIKISPARSTRSLNGLRVSSGERLARSTIRRINNAGSSSSSIPLTDLSSTSTLLGSHRTIDHDEIVESCRRAVTGILQNHIVVVPVDMTGYSGQFGGAGRISYRQTRVRTRHNSSPAAANFSTVPQHRISGIGNESSPIGGSSDASKTGSYCSDTRPLLGRYSSSSDGRFQLVEERMTSSDSNIDAKTGSPLASRRRLQAIDSKRKGIVGAHSVISKKVLGSMHQQSSASRPQRRCHAYQQQSSVPAVSKLIYDSLNLSFRFFQVPAAAVESNYSSSGKESLDSVFMGGGLIATNEIRSGVGCSSSSSRRATHPTGEGECPRSPASEETQRSSEQQDKSTLFIRSSDNKVIEEGLPSHHRSCESDQLQVVTTTVHGNEKVGGGGVIGRSHPAGVRSFAPAIDRRSSSTAESAIYSASASADTLPGTDSVAHSRLSASARIIGSSSSSSLTGGRAPIRRSMSSSELHLHRKQDEHSNVVITSV